MDHHALMHRMQSRAQLLLGETSPGRIWHRLLAQTCMGGSRSPRHAWESYAPQTCMGVSRSPGWRRILHQTHCQWVAPPWLIPQCRCSPSGPSGPGMHACTSTAHPLPAHRPCLPGVGCQMHARLPTLVLLVPGADRMYREEFLQTVSDPALRRLVTAQHLLGAAWRALAVWCLHLRAFLAFMRTQAHRPDLRCAP